MALTSLKILSALAISLLLMCSRASAQALTTKSSNLGMDISWPQCNVAVPTNQSFGVVGVNDGLANNTNPCLAAQLKWAARSSGNTAQAKAQLYVNTANPGGLNTASWPMNNVDSAGHLAPNPYGTCNHDDTLACAWQYGWNRSLEDDTQRFTPAATAAQLINQPSSYVWWLDVETGNTWKSGSSFANQSNTADLEGMTAYLHSVHATVGLYSTASQWQQIVGTSVSSSSNLNALANWRPGGANQSTAQQACLAPPLTSGGRVIMTQFIARSLDYDYSCI